jgi:hypothetical protein
VDYDKKELWTRAMSGNQRSDTIRRPFGCGIVGSVAETGVGLCTLNQVDP